MSLGFRLSPGPGSCDLVGWEGSVESAKAPVNGASGDRTKR